ncbi:hypothetical protein MMC21_006212 [Puttea exsequens]|nr:hypothetical protein [Puttea exsequens]
MAAKTTRVFAPVFRTVYPKTARLPRLSLLQYRLLNFSFPAPLHALHLRKPQVHFPQKSLYSTSPPFLEPTTYTVAEIRHLAAHPNPKRIIIDVREPSELQETGKVPGAYSMPITSNPDAFYLSDEEFYDRFGFDKPQAANTNISYKEGKAATSQSPYSPTMKQREADSGINLDSGATVDSEQINREAGYGEEEDAGVEEAVFYCKAGVRSRAAARLAREWQGIKIGDMTGGWLDWEKNGGEVEW